MEIRKLFADRIGGATFGQSNEVYKFAKIALVRITDEDSWAAVDVIHPLPLLLEP